MIFILISFVLSFLISLFVFWTLMKWLHSNQVKRAELEAQEIIQEAKDASELVTLDLNEKQQDIEMKLWTQEESSLLTIEDHLEELEEKIEEKNQKNNNLYSRARQICVEKERALDEYELELKEPESNLESLKLKSRTLNEEFINKISLKSQIPAERAKEIMIEDLKNQALKKTQEFMTSFLETTKENAETRAKIIIDRVLSRFQRPYCPERGIPGVYFENEAQRQKLMAPQIVPSIVEATGCDIIIEDQMDLIGVAGFDPVRRELTRRVLETLIKEKRPLNPELIQRITEEIKRSLMRQIKQDGLQLSREFRFNNLHPDVQKMMGSLRYRYSFTQNQYFHCGEVGWLCGLLAAELGGVSIPKALRSGMLHDLGKAMDHELEGGHAMIGAHFIAERNEDPEVVHAVKAHHYDEEPSTDLAFLVIAADAISGSRPGARRSTLESYTQKITELENIARSFDGVTDCFILSGGRECRVIVNGKRLDDAQSLKLSKEIASQIETECNYPGQIKVVVVRETITLETTRFH